MSASDRKAIAALDYLRVRGYYSTVYTRIVRPERVFAVTDYFRRHWVPLLKPGPAWLVVALRQHAYWNSQRDWCTVSREALAEECGLAVRTVDNYLAQPPVDWFVPSRQARYTARDRDGATRLERDWTRYGLRLDEPLTPAHQAALGEMAREAARELSTQGLPTLAGTARAKGDEDGGIVLAVAERLLAMTGEELAERMEEWKSGRTEGWEGGAGGPKSIQQILEEAVEEVAPHAPGEDGLPTLLSSACDALYLRIVRPDKVAIGTQYFRTRWVPELGAARAWLILHLRARCYLNAKQLEVRDTCTVGGLGELAGVLGVSISTVKACLAEPPAGTFLARLATHRPGAGQVTMTFRVEMVDPVREEDREGWGDGRGEQLTALPGHPPGGPAEEEAEFAGRGGGQETESAGRAEQEADFAGRGREQEPDFTGRGAGTNGRILQNTKVPTDDFSEGRTQQQRVLVRAAADDVPLAAAVGSLEEVLEGLHIDEPARSRLVALAPPMTAVLAWAIEALAQERIENKAGFIVSMLLGRYAPPPDLGLVGEMTVGRWRAVAAACRQARAAGGVDGLGGEPDPLFWPVYERLGRLAAAEWPVQEALPQSLPRRATQDVPTLTGEARAKDAEETEERGGLTGGAGAEERGAEETEREREGVWAAVLERMRGQMLALTFDAYLRDTRLLAMDGELWTVGAPYAYTRDWLSAQLGAGVRHAAQAVAGRAVTVKFVAMDA